MIYDNDITVTDFLLTLKISKAMEAIVIIAVIVVALIVISALSGPPRRRYNDYYQDYHDPHDPYPYRGRAYHHPPHHYPEPYHRHEHDEYSRRYGHDGGMGALLVGMTLFALFFIFISAA